MDELRRTALCLLSLGLACAVFWLIFGERLPASGNFSRHYPVFVAILLTVLMVAMVIALRGRLEKAAWPLLIGALLGYFAAPVSYIAFVGLFEREAFANLARKLPAIDLLLFVISVPSLATFSWLLGALSGAFFILSRYAVLRGGYARSFQQTPGRP
jgi:hypothetical protein